jgi:hypothetical protein
MAVTFNFKEKINKIYIFKKIELRWIYLNRKVSKIKIYKKFLKFKSWLNKIFFFFSLLDLK